MTRVAIELLELLSKQADFATGLVQRVNNSRIDDLVTLHTVLETLTQLESLRVVACWATQTSVRTAHYYKITGEGRRWLAEYHSRKTG